MGGTVVQGHPRNCNLGPISHLFGDMVSYWFKIAKFSYPPLI